jgi:hypothetical protein
VECLQRVLVGDARDDAIVIKVRADSVTEPGLEGVDDPFLPGQVSVERVTTPWEG